MRPFLLAAVSALLFAVTADAKPAPPKAPLPSSKAEPSLVGRAVLAKDLPRNITAADKTAIDQTTAEIKADHLESSLAIYRRWCDGSVKPYSREDVIGTALWAFREGALVKNQELANAADQLRWDEERNAAIDDSLALLKGAAIAKKPVLVAKIVVLSPYARESHGGEKHERQINRDAYNGEIQTLEKAGDEIKAERTKARSAYDAVAEKNARLLQTLLGLEHAAETAKLPNTGHLGG